MCLELTTLVGLAEVSEGMCDGLKVRHFFPVPRRQGLLLQPGWLKGQPKVNWLKVFA